MRFSWVALLVWVASACGGGSKFGTDAGNPNDAAAQGDAPFSNDSGVNLDGSTQPDGSSGGKTLLYAHSNTTLYQLDPTNLTAPIQIIGDFDCIGGSGNATSMTDIAVNKNGDLYAVSQIAAYPLVIQGSVVHCQATWTLPGNSAFYGLTFAPENTVAAAETLVAANSAGNVYSIDSQGQTTILGNFGKDSNNQTYELSGDIVFLANNGSPVGFATVRACPNGNCATSDTLVEIDMTKLKPNNTTSIVKSVRGVLHQGTSCTNSQQPPSYGKMYGIAAYEDQVYGFSHDTGIVAIDNNDASVCLISVPSNISWSGAGVTTVAPVIAPPN